MGDQVEGTNFKSDIDLKKIYGKRLAEINNEARSHLTYLIQYMPGITSEDMLREYPENTKILFLHDLLLSLDCFPLNSSNNPVQSLQKYQQDKLLQFKNQFRLNDREVNVIEKIAQPYQAPYAIYGYKRLLKSEYNAILNFLGLFPDNTDKTYSSFLDRFQLSAEYKDRLKKINMSYLKRISILVSETNRIQIDGEEYYEEEYDYNPPPKSEKIITYERTTLDKCCCKPASKPVETTRIVELPMERRTRQVPYPKNVNLRYKICDKGRFSTLTEEFYFVVRFLHENVPDFAIFSYNVISTHDLNTLLSHQFDYDKLPDFIEKLYCYCRYGSVNPFSIALGKIYFYHLHFSNFCQNLLFDLNEQMEIAELCDKYGVLVQFLISDFTQDLGEIYTQQSQLTDQFREIITKINSSFVNELRYLWHLHLFLPPELIDIFENIFMDIFKISFNLPYNDSPDLLSTDLYATYINLLRDKWQNSFIQEDDFDGLFCYQVKLSKNQLISLRKDEYPQVPDYENLLNYYYNEDNVVGFGVPEDLIICNENDLYNNDRIKDENPLIIVFSTYKDENIEYPLPSSILCNRIHRNVIEYYSYALKRNTIHEQLTPLVKMIESSFLSPFLCFEMDKFKNEIIELCGFSQLLQISHQIHTIQRNITTYQIDQQELDELLNKGLKFAVQSSRSAFMMKIGDILSSNDFNPGSQEIKCTRGYLFKIRPMFIELTEILINNKFKENSDLYQLIIKDIFLESLFTYAYETKEKIKKLFHDIIKNTENIIKEKHNIRVAKYESNKELMKNLILINDLDLIRSDVRSNLVDIGGLENDFQDDPHDNLVRESLHDLYPYLEIPKQYQLLLLIHSANNLPIADLIKNRVNPFFEVSIASNGGLHGTKHAITFKTDTYEGTDPIINRYGPEDWGIFNGDNFSLQITVHDYYSRLNETTLICKSNNLEYSVGDCGVDKNSILTIPLYTAGGDRSGTIKLEFSIVPFINCDSPSIVNILPISVENLENEDALVNYSTSIGIIGTDIISLPSQYFSNTAIRLKISNNREFKNMSDKDIYQTKFLDKQLIPKYYEVTPRSFGLFHEQFTYLKIELINRESAETGSGDKETVLGFAIIELSYDKYNTPQKEVIEIIGHDIVFTSLTLVIHTVYTSTVTLADSVIVDFQKEVYLELTKFFSSSDGVNDITDFYTHLHNIVYKEFTELEKAQQNIDVIIEGRFKPYKENLNSNIEFLKSYCQETVVVYIKQLLYHQALLFCIGELLVHTQINPLEVGQCEWARDLRHVSFSTPNDSRFDLYSSTQIQLIHGFYKKLCKEFIYDDQDQRIYENEMTIFDEMISLITLPKYEFQQKYKDHLHEYVEERHPLFEPLRNRYLLKTYLEMLELDQFRFTPEIIRLVYKRRFGDFH